MATRKPDRTTVDQCIAALDPILRSEVEALRRLILSVSPDIGEDVKWNAPSFFTGEHFATMRLHGKTFLQLILHLGAKQGAMPADAIDDPASLLTWLGPDRACIDVRHAGAVAEHADALRSILRLWIEHVPGRRT